MAALSLRKKIAFSLVVLAALWFLTEAVCLAGLWALEKYKGIEYQPRLAWTLSAKNRRLLKQYLASRDGYMRMDADLGWTVGPSAARRGYRSNRAGIRADRDYTPAPPPGAVRLAAFGDSFTHSSDVANPFTWTRALEELDPHLEVLNFGVPAYDPGQAFLRYQRDGVPFHPHIVLIGFMSENLYRTVNTFRPFYYPQSGVPLAKPRFALRGGRLLLIENPLRNRQAYRDLLRTPESVLPRLGRDDYFYQRSRPLPFDILPSIRFASLTAGRFDQEVIHNGVYNRDSEPYQVTLAILDAFAHRVLADGAQPVILLFPTHEDLVARRDGKPLVYQPLRDDLEQKGYHTIDMAEGFARHDPEGEVLHKRFVHYPRPGNRIVALTLYEDLRAEGLITPGDLLAETR